MIRRWALAPAAVALMAMAPGWISHGKAVGELIGMEYYGAILNGRSVTACRAYEYHGRRYVHCLPAPYAEFLHLRGPNILIEWKDGVAHPANGPTEAAMRRFRSMRLKLPDTAEHFKILDADVSIRFLRDGGPQPHEVLEAIKSGRARRVD